MSTMHARYARFTMFAVLIVSSIYFVSVCTEKIYNIYEASNAAQNLEQYVIEYNPKLCSGVIRTKYCEMYGIQTDELLTKYAVYKKYLSVKRQKEVLILIYSIIDPYPKSMFANKISMFSDGTFNKEI